MRQVLLLTSFYRSGAWGTSKLNILPKGTDCTVFHGLYYAFFFIFNISEIRMPLNNQWCLTIPGYQAAVNITATVCTCVTLAMAVHSVMASIELHALNLTAVYNVFKKCILWLGNQKLLCTQKGSRAADLKFYIWDANIYYWRNDNTIFSNKTTTKSFMRP